ncbi:MAG: DNA mismatch repair protein MutS [Nanobdellota archaeon]
MKLTPAMKQYMEAKEKYPECILLFRMGDFYECFYDDAIKVSKLLNITLTNRGKGENKAPLSGIPYHSVEKYISKLVNAGNKVAICEQMEDPKNAKGVVKREVVRIMTPGTVVEDSILSPSSNNYIASIFGQDFFGVSFVDISTGEFIFGESKKLEQIFQEISRKNVSEIIIGAENENIKKFCERNNIFLNIINESNFWITKATKGIKDHYNKEPEELGFKEKDYALCSAGALINHLHNSQKQSLSYLKIPKIIYYKEYMSLDKSTIRNLELLKNISDGTTRGTLLSVLDNTRTPMGARKIKNWITHPLMDENKIKLRYGAVDELRKKIIECDEIREKLKQFFDIERLVSKINYKLTSTKDLVNLKNSLNLLNDIKQHLSDFESRKITSLTNFPDMSELIKIINDSISEEDNGNYIVRSGSGYSEGGDGRRSIGMIKKGYDKELDTLYDLKFNTKQKIKDLEKNEQEKTGMTLKVGYNKVFGYYIEVSNKFKESVPKHYIRKQTLVNGERFITEDLKKFEEELQKAEEKIITIEDNIIDKVIQKVSENTESIQKISDMISQLDVLSSFSKKSYDNDYCMPEINNGYELKIKKSRHPVIEELENQFIPNDCYLNKEEFLMLITGPNMAGKSTYMRQVAINILMAQIGCFVPAESAKISIVDRLLSRVGAYDDLSTGQSTFMIEMNETADILNNATERSFIILDEIGRGTSTFDGVSIAWSVAEYILKKIKAKTVFATHYHVLTKLEDIHHKGIVNYNIAVSEKDDEIIFLRKIRKGGTDKSYGIQVAKLAGLPPELIENAKNIQYKLEKEDEMVQRITLNKKNNNYSVSEQKKIDEW